MRRILYAAVLAVPLCAAPAQAQTCFCCPGLPPTRLDGSVTLRLNLWAGGGQTQLGPWYLYWPYDAHFQSPPPLGPSMPGPSFMTLPPQFGQGGQHGAPAPQPGGQPWTPPPPTPVQPGQKGPSLQQSSYQPVGYSYYTGAAPSYWSTGTAPSYWYGR
jgi:hypothetical protein